MKFRNPSLKLFLNGRTNERTSRKQYAPHFFKVGGIIRIFTHSHSVDAWLKFMLVTRRSKLQMRTLPQPELTIFMKRCIRKSIKS